MQYSAFVKVVYDAWQISKWITEWSIYRNDQNSFSENFSNLTIFDHKICPKSFENVKIINPLHNTVREYFLGGVGGGTIIKLYSFFFIVYFDKKYVWRCVPYHLKLYINTYMYMNNWYGLTVTLVKLLSTLFKLKGKRKENNFALKMTYHLNYHVIL